MTEQQPGIVWWPEPSVGDIVWCHFPHLPGLLPGPKPRPALAIKVFDDHAPHFFVLVAYGTSKNIRPSRAGEFAITSQEDSAYRLAGLSFDTKFDFNRTVELPYSSDYFKPPPLGNASNLPQLGLLHASMMRKAQAAWSAAKT